MTKHKVDAEEKSQEAPKNVPTAETPKPSQSAKPLIPPKAASMLKSLGVDPSSINELADWKVKVDQTLTVIVDHLKKQDEQLTPLFNSIAEAQKMRTQMQGQPQPQPQGGGINIADILQVFKAVGGGEENPIQVKVNTLFSKVLDNAIDSVGQKSAFERYFDEELAKTKAKVLASQVQGGS